jgi:Laminin G domain
MGPCTVKFKFLFNDSRYIEFRYDLGTGPSLIRSLREIKVGQWHRVQAKRWHKDGILKVDQVSML